MSEQDSEDTSSDAGTPTVKTFGETWAVPILVVEPKDKRAAPKWRERNVLEVEKRNLMALAKLVVRDVIESSMVQGRMLDSDHVPLQHFFVILEHSLRHGMKMKRGLLAPKRDVWELLQEVERFVPEAREITLSVKELPTVKTGSGRARAWLRLALMQKRLPDYYKALTDHRDDLLSHFYDPVALMMSDESVVLTGLLLGLNVIDSNLCIKEEELDFDGSVVDLTTYLKSAAPGEPAVASEDPMNPESMAAVLDQKNYLEELNRHLTSQVTNLQARVESLTATNDLLKTDLAATKNHNVQLAEETRALGTMLMRSTAADLHSGRGEESGINGEGQFVEQSLVREGGDGASCNSPPTTKVETFDQVQAVAALRKKLMGEENETLRLHKELELQTAIKNEMETAMKLLEKDIHEKQDTIVSLRRQLDDIKVINLEMYKKLQESETSVKHKVEMVSRLEGKTAAMAETIKAFELKLVNLETQKAAAEETARKLGQFMADKDLALTTLESDLKVEKEWRQSLEDSLVKDRHRMAEMSQEIARLGKISRDYDNLQVAFKDLERTCDDYERSMEELGVHLYESKLKVDDLKEATGVIKNAQWKDDSEVVQCHGCEKDFSISRRKHHCRACGSIFCHACSDNRMPLQCSKKPVRVCDSCYTRLLERYSAVNKVCNVGFKSHSKSSVVQDRTMKVRVIPALSDNYMYLLVDPATNEAGIVDPVDPGAVMLAVNEEKVNLTSVLTTHHHWDHAGGNEHIVKLVKGLKVYGGDERIGALTNKVGHGDKFKLGSLDVECLHTPCHTSGHICYYVTSPEGGQGDNAPAVFTGDTLFIAGCGRFFEGTPDQMYSALVGKLAKLPDSTRVYCGHEYTVKNMEFGLKVEPNNPDLKKELEWAKDCRAKELPTVPSTIGKEKKINPFMRVDQEPVMEHCHKHDPIETMGTLRAEKDRF